MSPSLSRTRSAHGAMSPSLSCTRSAHGALSPSPTRTRSALGAMSTSLSRTRSLDLEEEVQEGGGFWCEPYSGPFEQDDVAQHLSRMLTDKNTEDDHSPIHIDVFVTDAAAFYCAPESTVRKAISMSIEAGDIVCTNSHVSLSGDDCI